MKSRVVLSVLAMYACPALAEVAGDRPAQTDRQTVPVTARASPLVAPQKPDVFGTVAINAGVTAYGSRWRRVSAADLADPRVSQIAESAAGLNPLAKLIFVHSAVRSQIAWRSDLETYHVSDYWAEAGETLDRGTGDAEDIAILKMQALKAAGFQAHDLYLSVGRDRSRGADTLLLVRVDNHFYALDDRSDRPLSARDYARFVPVITLGKDAAWLHGKRYVGRTARAQILAAR